MSKDSLAPPLQRMSHNRCYRVNLIHEDFGPSMQKGNKQSATNDKITEYQEQDLYAEDDDDDEIEANLEELPNSMFKLSVHVAQAFYGGLIGFKGSTKRRIETETRTDIYIPRREIKGSSSGKSEHVTIKGTSRSDVCAAYRKVKLLIVSLRKRMKATHFAGVKTNFGEVRERFEELKKRILAAQYPGIDESLFQTSTHLHLTLSTCVLLDDAERAKALELLQGCDDFLKNLKTPFTIKVSGLEIMNDDPSAVRVLYGRVEAPELQKFANHIVKVYEQAGLSQEESFSRNDVKLHMTIMNNRYKNVERQSKNFNASEILKNFGEYDFGTIECSEVHLCIMNSSDKTTDAFYKTSGSLKF